MQATDSGYIVITVSVDTLGEEGDCKPGIEYRIRFSVVDTGCGFGSVDPNTLFNKYNLRSDVQGQCQTMRVFFGTVSIVAQCSHLLVFRGPILNNCGVSVPTMFCRYE